eukprot:24317-Eustigmatos_ZCMA.PRE.1
MGDWVGKEIPPVIVYKYTTIREVRKVPNSYNVFLRYVSIGWCARTCPYSCRTPKKHIPTQPFHSART